MALSLLDELHSRGGYALGWCHGALSRTASFRIELFSPGTTLPLVYMFHEINVSIPGYNLCSVKVGI